MAIIAQWSTAGDHVQLSDYRPPISIGVIGVHMKMIAGQNMATGPGQGSIPGGGGFTWDLAPNEVLAADKCHGDAGAIAQFVALNIMPEHAEDWPNVYSPYPYPR